ncbi:DUF374 domain-containing protein [Ferruginivarius sediminum]|uniref:DUF374 domain-containing protein n=2 Tax=Ferruginivarius sediminum TaxID=2661937 RepID=A0A369TDA3_9PROT|nr:DUF374 domain-containing protein [Ferruginivarius sediminum]
MRLSKRILKSDMGQRLLSHLAAFYVRLVAWTTRWQIETGPVDRLVEEGEAAIGAFWHGRLLMSHLGWKAEQPRIHMMISRHRDGALIARTIGHLGFSTVDADSKTGGLNALRAMKRCLDAGDWVAITPDGPRGPRMRAKAGTIKLAQLTGAPVVPASVAMSRRRILNSWDRFQLALPFGRGIIRCGEPIRVPRDADADTLERARQALEDALNGLTGELDRRCGVPVVEPAPQAMPETDTPATDSPTAPAARSA